MRSERGKKRNLASRLVESIMSVNCFENSSVFDSSDVTRIVIYDILMLGNGTVGNGHFGAEGIPL